MRNPETEVVCYSGTLSKKDVEDASFVSLDNVSLGITNMAGSQFSRSGYTCRQPGLYYRLDRSDPNPSYTDSAPDQGTYGSSLMPGIDRRSEWFRTRSVTLGANIVF
jgi:iron complex outermembrane receptor protein